MPGRVAATRAAGRCARAALALIGAAALLGIASARAEDILPLDQVRPGMEGVGRTVFEGTRIDEFKVKIIGVLDNVLGPKQSLILARLEGGPLAETGVIAGMSGSPVLIDGRLVGAVSYSFPFAKETIAGITPIGQMIESTRTESGRAASTRFPVSFGPGGPALPLSREALVEALKRPLPALAAPAGAVPSSLAGATLRPLALPLVFTGFAPETFEWAKGVFGGLGFTPVLGAGHSNLPAEPLPALEPGAAVGLSLIEGDLDLSVTGTITHIDHGRVYAFGHPFYNLGPTQFPMKKAYVFSVFPSIYQSWKISTAAESVGTVDQDRSSAIAGHLGKPPRMIPVKVDLATSRGEERHYAFRIVDDELFSPVLAYLSVLSVLQSNERHFGTSSIRIDGTLKVAGEPDVHVSDLYTDNQPAVQAAALVAGPLAYLMSNDMRRLTVEGVDVSVSSDETVNSAELERAWLERPGPVRAGSTVDLKLLLRTYRGQETTESIPVSVPDTARPGGYTLLVADGSALTAIEQREMKQDFVPRDVDQLIRALNGLRHNDRIYARLLRADQGAVVSGEYMQALPPSVLDVLGSGERGSAVTRIGTTSVWDFELPTDYAVTGLRRLALTIER